MLYPAAESTHTGEATSRDVRGGQSNKEMTFGYLEFKCISVVLDVSVAGGSPNESAQSTFESGAESSHSTEISGTRGSGYCGYGFVTTEDHGPLRWSSVKNRLQNDERNSGSWRQ
ncbi:hypothetical protein BC938DRAFT_478090, partial [Jimgerdemannia flammicorona]